MVYTYPKTTESSVIIGQVASKKSCVDWEFDSKWQPELEYYLTKEEFASHMYHINWITTTTFGPHPKRIAYLVIYSLGMGALIPIFFLYLSALWAYVFIAGVVSTVGCGVVKYCRVKTAYKEIMQLVLDEKNNMHADRNMQWLLRHEKKEGKIFYWIYLFYDEEAEYYEDEAVPQQPGSPHKSPRVQKKESVPPV